MNKENCNKEKLNNKGTYKKGKSHKNIRLKLQIERRESPALEPYLQMIFYETANENATLATALTDINNNDYLDESGEKVKPIMWQNACLQKKCGACAMVVNGIPRLACNCFLRDYKKSIMITPFKKFPIIKDLVVDRSLLFDNLEVMENWIEGDANISDKHSDAVYEASRCLQCGCCLEVCPNFQIEDEFYGAAAFVPTTGILLSMPDKYRKELIGKYNTHIYEGCGKSLSCQKICPAGIDIEHMLINSNKIAFWKKKH